MAFRTCLCFFIILKAAVVIIYLSSLVRDRPGWWYSSLIHELELFTGY